MENLVNIIGENLSKLRKDRGYSFDQMSQLTGVSKSMLSQIEKGQKTPTVNILWKIAHGLNVAPSLLMEENKPSVEVIKVNKSTVLVDDDGKYKTAPFIPFDKDRKFEVYKMALEPGCVHKSEPHFKNMNEYVFVCSGTLKIVVEKKVYEVKSGEAIIFPGDVNHSYENISGEKADTFILFVY